jgi:hypothetical protein
MQPIPIQVHSLLDIDYTNRFFPRPRWKGQLMLYLAGSSAALVGNGSILRLAIEPPNSQPGEAPEESLFCFDAKVEEMPFIRLPSGIAAAAIIQRPEAIDFGPEGRLLAVRRAEIIGGYVGVQEMGKPGGH